MAAKEQDRQKERKRIHVAIDDSNVGLLIEVERQCACKLSCKTLKESSLNNAKVNIQKASAYATDPKLIVCYEGVCRFSVNSFGVKKMSKFNSKR